jgi:hypothetical protein
MAVVNIKSALITNADSTPAVLNSPYQSFSRPIVQTAVAAIGATDTAASVYRFARIPSSALIQDIRLLNETSMTTGTSYKCGVLSTATDGGAVVVTNSDTIFFSAVSLVTARTVWTSVYSPSILAGAAGAANTALRIWELLGLTADPIKMYDLAVTGVTVATVGGNLALQVSYDQ